MYARRRWPRAASEYTITGHAAMAIRPFGHTARFAMTSGECSGPRRARRALGHRRSPRRRPGLHQCQEIVMSYRSSSSPPRAPESRAGGDITAPSVSIRQRTPRCRRRPHGEIQLGSSRRAAYSVCGLAGELCGSGASILLVRSARASASAILRRTSGLPSTATTPAECARSSSCISL
jgi:hypothetical protein